MPLLRKQSEVDKWDRNCDLYRNQIEEFLDHLLSRYEIIEKEKIDEEKVEEIVRKASNETSSIEFGRPTTQSRHITQSIIDYLKGEKWENLGLFVVHGT